MALPRTSERAAPVAPAVVSIAPVALSIDGVTVRYGSGPALDNISFSINRGEQIGVVGPNGAGKSTLFKLIVGLIQPDSGSVKLAGATGSVAYVPQRSQVDWRFPVNVRDVVMMGRVKKIGLFRRATRRDHEAVAEALALVNLSDLAQRQISELSGGQQQRVFLARALAQEAELLLMDEPLNGLDIPSQEDIFRILGELRARNITVLTALHDLQLAARQFDRVMLLNRRLIGLGTADSVFTSNNLLNAYGGHLHLSLTSEGVLTVADTCCCEE